MKSKIIIHPVLFAIFPVMMLYFNNMYFVSFSETLLPLAITVGITIPIWIILKLILKDDVKSALITSLILVLCFSYGYAFLTIDDLTINDFDVGKHRYLAIPFLAVFIIGIFYLIKTKKRLNVANTITNVGSLTIVIITLVNIGAYNLENSFSANFEDDPAMGLEYITNEKELPDIFYIILDAYPGSDSLKTTSDYDNSDFVSYLKQKEFFVNEKSFANYPRTIQSLSSSLNMEYLYEITEQVGVNSKSYHLLNEHLSDNKVMSNMKSRGYVIVNMGSMWGPNTGFAEADVNLCEFKQINSNSLMNELLLSSMLGYVQERFTEQGRRDAILCTFDELYTINEKIPKQKFVFAHIQLPHSPFIFGPNGEHVTPGIPLNSSKWDDRKAHIDQIKFANKKLKVLIDKILESEETPIIILQGDTGSLITGGFSESSIITIRERLSNLNAIYIPDEKYDLFYDGMTPVNTFRIIENTVFNGDYLLLKDKTYWSTKDTPHNYKDVSNHLLN